MTNFFTYVGNMVRRWICPHDTIETRELFDDDGTLVEMQKICMACGKRLEYVGV